ncbi:MAG TPA: TolC family protein [Lacipirellulaceae bacterium]|nr:TolC family protein [Lacipirellulaceae bacterium]
MALRFTACAAAWLGLAAGLCLAAQPSASKDRATDNRESMYRLPAVETPAVAVTAAPPATQADPAGNDSNTSELPSGPAASVTNSAVTGSVTVEQLVALARQDNPSIRAARLKASAMLQVVPQARSLDDPMLMMTFFPMPPQTASGPQEFMLGLQQKFPWFGKRNARGEIAYYDAQAAFSDLADIELGVIEQVKLAFYDLYFLDQSDRIYRELRPRIADLITIARQRYETNSAQVGLESVLQAQIRLRELDITLVKIDQGKAKAAARLAQAIHLPRGAGIDIQPRLDRSPQPRQVEILVEMLDVCHPRLRARREALTRDDWRIDLAQRDYFPDVTVGINWGAIGEHGLSPAANGDDDLSISLGMNLPIYMNKRRAEVREARLRAGQSSQEYEAAWDALRADVEQNYADVREQDAVLKILNQDILKKSQQTFDLSTEAYRVGRIGFQQFIDNYDTLLRLRIEYYMRTATREQAIARLERSVGCAIAEPAADLQQPGEQLPEPTQP